MRILVFLALAACLSLVACDKAYYSTMESMGVHKRDILVDRVDDAREAQSEAKEEFASALDAFRAVTGFSGGELEQRYENLKAAYEDSRGRANAVNERVGSVRKVAEDLFAEWESELAEYSNPELRADSRAKLQSTRREYSRLITAMERAADRMDPVLAAFQDQVLYLKHNLNARAVASLKGELARVESDVEQLIEAMNASIAQAERFIAGLETG
jgi:DNA repair exonuclease SbcCD ATPase subunit